jgi:hypothetical protein
LLASELPSFEVRFHRRSTKNHLAQLVAQPLSLFCVGGTAESLDKILKFSPLLFLPGFLTGVDPLSSLEIS